jgi:hypothetical protein
MTAPAPSLDRMLALAEELDDRVVNVGVYKNEAGTWSVDILSRRGWMANPGPTRAAAVAAACAELERLVKERREK